MSKKSRKLIRSAKPEGAAVPASGAATAAVAGSGAGDLTAMSTRRFFFLPDVAPAHVDERELHDLIKDWRHGRATRSIGEAIQDAYVTIFSVVMIGAMVVNLVIKAQTTVANCASATCLSARTLVPWAVLAAAFALALGLSHLFGPVLASAAEGFWLMDAPISRSRLLRGRLLLAVSAAFVLGGVLGGLTAALSGTGALGITLWAAGAALGCAGLVAFAAAQQGIERHRLVRATQGAFSALALGAILLVVAIASGRLQVSLISSAATWVPGAVTVLASAGLAIGLVVAVRRLEGIRRARLVSGGSLVSGMQGAMFALDFGLIRDILVEREAQRRGHVRATRGRGLGINALVWRDVQRLARFPRPLIAFVVSALAPYAVDALGLTALSPFISGLILVVVLVPFLGSLRVLTRTGGLARSLPFKTSAIRTAVMVVPAVLSAVWALAAVPAFAGVVSGVAERSGSDAAVTAFVTALAGWLGAVRWVTAKKVDFNAPMVATDTGALPPTLIFNLFRGFDMVALITAPVMLGGSAWISLILGLIAFVVLRGTFNTDELKAEQEAMQREQAAQKEAARAERIKVPRPQR